MTDEVKAQAALLADLADNSAHLITAQRLRNALVTTWDRIGRRSVREFGCKVDGASDDTAALQSAIDSGERLAMPTGTLITTAPVTYQGRLDLVGEGSNRSIVKGTFAAPVFHRAGAYLDWDDTVAGTLPAGVISGIRVEDLTIDNPDPHGCCFQIWNSMAPLVFARVHFRPKFRGLLLLQQFGALVLNCSVTGTYFVSNTLDDGEYLRAFGLLAGYHTTILETTVTGCGVGVATYGVGVNISGGRQEVNGVGMWLGTQSYSLENLGGASAWRDGYAMGLTQESNFRGLLVDDVERGARVSNITTIAATSESRWGGAPCDYGVMIAGGRASSVVANLRPGGAWARAAVVYGAGLAEVRGIDATNNAGPVSEGYPHGMEGATAERPDPTTWPRDRLWWDRDLEQMLIAAGGQWRALAWDQ